MLLNFSPIFASFSFFYLLFSFSNLFLQFFHWPPAFFFTGLKNYIGRIIEDVGQIFSPSISSYFLTFYLLFHFQFFPCWWERTYIGRILEDVGQPAFGHSEIAIWDQNDISAPRENFNGKYVNSSVSSHRSDLLYDWKGIYWLTFKANIIIILTIGNESAF